MTASTRASRKQWRRRWPPGYDQMLAQLRHTWPDGRGVQEFVRILQWHQTYSSEVMQQAIEQALRLGCGHLDGVLYCIHQVQEDSEAVPADPLPPLDLSARPDLQAFGANQSVNLAQYDRLLQSSW